MQYTAGNVHHTIRIDRIPFGPVLNPYKLSLSPDDPHADMIITMVSALIIPNTTFFILLTTQFSAYPRPVFETIDKDNPLKVITKKMFSSAV